MSIIGGKRMRYTRVLSYAALTFTLTLTASTAILAQEITPITPEHNSVKWCQDSGTICTSDSQKRPFFAGVRIIGEPSLGTTFAQGANRIETSGFAKFALFGAETDLYGRWASLQGVAVLPGRVKFDSLSPLVINKRIVDPNGEVGLDLGLGIGASFIDGSIAIGFGWLRFDQRGIVNATDAERHSSFVYFNFQAVSAVRAAIKTFQNP